jgi:antitoxin MazE
MSRQMSRPCGNAAESHENAHFLGGTSQPPPTLYFYGVYYVLTKGFFLMTKTLTKHGNSYALVIDKPILELLQITPETPLEMITNGDTLVVRAIRNKKRQDRLDKTLKEVNRKFGRALKKLAE